MTVRRVLSLLCLALCATALAGCGGDTLALDPVAKAANRTAHAESSRFVFSASLTAANMGSFSFHGNGLYDGKNNSGWANMHFNLPPQVMAQFGSDPSMEMIFDGSDGLVMYMRSGLFKTLPPGTWVKMDVAKLAKKEGYDLDALMSANQADPSQALKMLMASSGARVTGFDTVRGVQTTHYTFRIDFKRLLHNNKSLRQLREVAGADSIPAEAWIDKQGRVRRLTVNMSIGAQYGTGMSMTITEDLYDFGVKANVVPPPDSLVTDISKLTGSSS